MKKKALSESKTLINEIIHSVRERVDIFKEKRRLRGCANNDVERELAIFARGEDFRKPQKIKDWVDW